MVDIQHIKCNKGSAVAEMGDRLATTDMGRNLGLCLFWGEGTGSPSSTMWPGPMPTSVPSGILIPPTRLAAVHQRHLQDRQTGQRSDSIRRTVLQTVVQKLKLFLTALTTTVT